MRRRFISMSLSNCLRHGPGSCCKLSPGRFAKQRISIGSRIANASAPSLFGVGRNACPVHCEMDRVLLFRYSMNQIHQTGKRNRRLSFLASVALLTGLFGGSGFASRPVVDPGELPLQITKLSLIDQVVGSSERHLRTLNAAPRRQTPGAITFVSQFELTGAYADGSHCETRLPSSAAFARPNDRAPPSRLS